jgi:hypothetical protein
MILPRAIAGARFFNTQCRRVAARYDKVAANDPAISYQSESGYAPMSPGPELT